MVKRSHGEEMFSHINRHAILFSLHGVNPSMLHDSNCEATAFTGDFKNIDDSFITPKC